MIHLISNDDSYLIYTMSTSDVVAKLGEDNPFHIKRTPIPYSSVWKEPLCLDFGPGEETTKELVPDVAVRNGRMFFNEKAYSLLGSDLTQDGEFLPVTYLGGTGYIFNPLTVAEKYDALDESVTVFNEYGEVENLGFREDKLPAGTMAFRSKAGSYYDVFCTDQMKKAIEDSGLVGVCFHPDLADIGGGATTQH
ncbi:hypothetical protein GNX18_06660 [Microbulbifer sp. SH-1]|uniref:hypothetical protein n=1 Tax=Microbulbifer sp. SH-1 TaxID=2681547 RepID=UPI0014096C5A|nr:hypothetical protein [Microbulbifer sp. SH-1]QIL89473.1 hypothetical protein GNX18_06660 [Microbulbifer sp. SH-1]